MGEKTAELLEENVQLKATIVDLQSRLKQCESDKLQLQTSYEEALQALADSEAKRETVDKELRLAHDQISSMWKELDALRKRVEGSAGLCEGERGRTQSFSYASSNKAVINEGYLELQCTLCKEKINSSSSKHVSPERPTTGGGRLTPSPEGSPKTQQRSRRGSWLFGRKQQRVQDLEAHSKVCSSSQSSPKISSNSRSSSPKVITKKSVSSPSIAKANIIPGSNSGSNSPKKQSPRNSALVPEEYLVVNVTRSSLGATDLAPFKIITKTNLSHFRQTTMEVHRSQGDFQWLYEALQEACPERVVPPLKPPISLDATMSEFQRFLSRIAIHKTLRKQHHFVVFLSGTAEELRSLRAKHRPLRHGDQVHYKPAVGRDTNTGPLVATKDYLTTLEQNIVGLINHLEQAARKTSSTERIGHWFRAISESEPPETYLKMASCDLARTCEVMEGQQTDSDELLFIHNLQSVADYVRTAQDLLTRVEEAVDKFLYWDEEVTIIEAVTSSPVVENPPSQVENSEEVFDDSGVSVSSSGNNSSTSDPNHHHHQHETASTSSATSETSISTSEKWAQASKFCADAKDYLEMMCNELAEELAHFDLQKEKELKQVLVDYAGAQLERHEKFQGKWFAMKLLLDVTISPEKRAIQFTNAAAATASNDSTKNNSTTNTAESH